MARLTFRQGILQHYSSSSVTQRFLQINNGYVNLICAQQSFKVTVIDRENNYLFEETKNVLEAWGPFDLGNEYWLYLDYDIVTGERTFGHTDYEPIIAQKSPNNVNNGQMWFNTITKEWFEWNGVAWFKVLRVFACKLDTLLIPRSMSMRAPSFIGSQVGLDEPCIAGKLVYDNQDKPIKKLDGTFFTTEDLFVLGIPQGTSLISSLKLSNVVLRAKANMPLAAFQVVEYHDFNKVVSASPFSSATKVYGITNQSAEAGSEITFVLDGIIFNEDWDWTNEGAEINDPVYIDDFGVIQATPAIPGQQPVGTVISDREIIFDPSKFNKGSGTNVNVNSILDLSDTPNTFENYAGYALTVNVNEDGLELSPLNPNGSVWGNITGSIANQSDLHDELQNIKSDIQNNASLTNSILTDLLTHEHSLNQITDFNMNDFATYDQGLLADTALQPNDDISKLVNDVGYLTSETDPVYLSEKGQPHGVPILDFNGKIYSNYLPSITVNDTFVAQNEPSMLALPATSGDIAVVLDQNKTYILQGTDPTILGHWQELLTPTSSVLSVNGYNGNVVLTSSDVGAAATFHTHSIHDLLDVSNIAPSSNNQVLKWNGIDQYVPDVIQSDDISDLLSVINTEINTISLSQLTDVNLQTPPTDGNILSWNNSAQEWTPTLVREDLIGTIFGKTGSNEIKFVYATNKQSFVVKNSINGDHVARAVVGATDNVILNIMHVDSNNTETLVGTINFNSSGSPVVSNYQMGDILIPSDFTLSFGDLLTVVNPNAEDDTLETITFTLESYIV